MARLQEKTVQKRAMDFLKNYYHSKFFRRKIFVGQEIKTKRAFGGKRADGLLAFKNWFLGKPFVVSLEAKSIKTLPAIKPYQDYRRWLYNSLRMGFFIGLGSGIFYIYTREMYGISMAAPLIFVLLSGFSFGLLTWSHSRHKTIDVITQLKQYPANEQWLAFSWDGFRALTAEKQKMLQSVCQFRGIGLLLIEKNNGTTVLSKPKRKWSWFWETRGGLKWIPDYLVYYSKEQEIRKFI